MRVLVIENYPKTTLGLVGEALAEAGAECRIVRTHLGDSLPATPDGYRRAGHARRRAGCARRREPSLPDARGGARPRLRRGRQGRARHLPRRADSRPRPRRRRTFSAGRSSSAGTRCARPRPAAPIRCSRRSATAAPIFHWHLDTFTLPPGATHLATSEQTPMQAFRIGRAVLRHPVPFRGRHRARRELDARLRRRDRGLRAGLAEAPSRRKRRSMARRPTRPAWRWRAPGSALIVAPSPSRQEPARKAGKATVSEWST